MKIIVTGATGFIGRNIAEKFHDYGFDVLATGRSEQIGNEFQKQGIKFRKADIINQEQVISTFTKADYLIHCAAKTADWGKYKEFYDTNVIGTKNVIKACKANSIKRIIFVSTPSVYFSGYDRLNISENDPLPAKQFYYGKTKLIAERELLALKEEGFKTIILRPRAVYGQYDNSIVPRILKLAEKKRFPLINKGKALVDITYVDNFTDAVRNCLSVCDKAWNEVYNISNGDPISIREWFSIVLGAFDRPFKPVNIAEPVAKTFAGIMEIISILASKNTRPAMTQFSVGYMAKSMTLSIEKAKQNLNYLPMISNQRGFEDYKKWCVSSMIRKNVNWNNKL